MLVIRDFSGLNMPQEHGHLSCRPRATSGAAFGAGKVLLKCLLQYVGRLFLCGRLPIPASRGRNV